MKVRKAEIITKNPAPLFCGECGKETYSCAFCGDDFVLGEKITCLEWSKIYSCGHYCSTCGEKYMEDGK